MVLKDTVCVATSWTSDFLVDKLGLSGDKSRSILDNIGLVEYVLGSLSSFLSILVVTAKGSSNVG